MADTHFTCWVADTLGMHHRIEVVATTEVDARRLAFASCPRAVFATCRAAHHVDQERRHG